MPEQAELVAFRIAEKQVVSVFRYQGRPELLQPFQLSPSRLAPQVEVDAILHGLRLWHQLEEKPWRHTRRLDEDAGIVFRVKDSHTAQPCEFRFIVRSNLVVIQGGSPETGGRRGVTAVKYNVVKSGHGQHHLPADSSALQMRELILETRAQSDLFWLPAITRVSGVGAAQAVT